MDTSDRKYVEHPDPQDPARIDRWYLCPCCGYPTLGAPWNYEICDLCHWMDDGVNDSCHTASGNIPLAQARENFQKYITKFPPGTNGFDNQTERDVAAKRRLIGMYDAYMAESDPAKRSILWRKIARLSDLL